MQAAELLVLAGVITVLYALLGPVRRRLERWVARRLEPRKPARRARVVELLRKPDGTFGREDNHDG
jgi:hypothetical protein